MKRASMKTAAALTLILVLYGLCVAQGRKPSPDPPEFGDISELASFNKVFVYCRDLKIRQAIADEIKKEPGLEIVGRLDDAKIVINYDYESVTLSRDRGVFGTSTKTDKYNGEFTVSIAGSLDAENRVRERIVWSDGKDRPKGLGKNPYIKAARAFLEDYRKMRQNHGRQ